MDIVNLLKSFCEAVEQCDGPGFAALFTENAVYPDVFYGAFAGRERLTALIPGWFYKSASDFRWDMHDPVCDGRTPYARYTFSFQSLLAEAQGARELKARAEMTRHLI